MTTDLAPLAAVSRRSMLKSEQLAVYIQQFLERRKLKPAFTAFYLTRWNEMDIFIAVLDTEQIPNQNPYKGDLLHQLSTDLGGLPVYLSNTTGLRYVVPLTALPKLPRKIDLPAADRHRDSGGDRDERHEDSGCRAGGDRGAVQRVTEVAP